MRRVFLVLFALGFLGCGNPLSYDNTETKEIIAKNPFVLDDKSSQYFDEPKMASYQIAASHDGILVGGTFTLALSCDNVYGTGQNGDWAQNNVSATTSVNIPAAKNCRITLTNYNDGTNTFNAVLTSLVATISTSGTITSSAASQYSSGGGSPIKEWFYASQAAVDSIQFNYAADAITATTSITPTSINIQTVSLAISGVTPPAVSGLTLYSLGAINSASATYTLVATVTGSTSCKYIDNSSSTYNATSWNSVNNAYNNASAVTCPSFTPVSGGGTTGNWTNNYGGTGQKTLIIWVNTVNTLNAYTTANF